MKVKLFLKNDPLGSKGQNQRDLENEVNAWLEQNASIEVREIKQSSNGGSFSPSLLCFSVWYVDVA